jgi:coenzyme F420 hydrogenase subunit delta
MASAVPEIGSKPILVLGCGNVLFGDDGFGPAVAEHLHSRADLPDGICVINAGTSVREVLFDAVLSEKKPRKIIIVDAMDKGLKPGELFRPSVDDVPLKKLDDFSMHQLPASNLLRELRDLCGVEVDLIVCQVQTIPESVSPGLSPPVQAAVSRAADTILRECAGTDLRVAAQSP